MAVADAGEDGDDFGVAFKPVQLDRRLAGSEAVEAGVADERLGAGLGEHVPDLLLGHAQRLDGEERVEQPRGVGLVAGDDVAIAGQGLQLALLAVQLAAERAAGARAGRLRIDRQQRTLVDRGLVRQQRERIGACRSSPAAAGSAPARRASDRAVPSSDRMSCTSSRVADAAKSRRHSGMLKLECLPPGKQAMRNGPSARTTSGSTMTDRCSAVVGDHRQRPSRRDGRRHGPARR